MHQIPLSPHPTTVTGQRSVAANNPVTRNNDGNPVAPIGRSHRPNGFQVSDRNRLLFVRSRLAIGNVQELFPYSSLRFTALKIQLNARLLPFPFKLFVYITPRLFNYIVRAV